MHPQSKNVWYISTYSQLWPYKEIRDQLHAPMVYPSKIIFQYPLYRRQNRLWSQTGHYDKQKVPVTVLGQSPPIQSIASQHAQ